MRWKELQILVESIIGGDHVLVKDSAKRLALLNYALHEVANRATTLRLLTDNTDEHIIRQAREGTFIREAVLPENDEEVVDIDTGLCFAVARYMASFISKEDKTILRHEYKASQIILKYNSKVESFLNSEEGKNYGSLPNTEY